jgi:hypothetical protein
MAQPAASCPNCGAKIVFRWSSSVQTVCEHCKSILIRTDVDLKKVGQVADLPPNSSPIQLGSEGIHARKAFVAIGRIIYEYVVSFAAPGRKLPPAGQSQVGQEYIWDNESYTVATITQAHYRGVEGELPFQYWDKHDVQFVDLRSASGKFATLDYSDEQPVLYLGEMVDFDQLALKNLRQFEGWS